MQLHFYKYHGTGNDFILLDNRQEKYPEQDEKLYRNICHRRFGIGADGVILLQPHKDYDFEMRYFNSDGRLGSMCGNGARCIVAFARQLGMIKKATTFAAYDGPHKAQIKANSQVRLQMRDVTENEMHPGHVIMDTGSPHYVTFVEDVGKVAVEKEGKAIRDRKPFRKNGINVNFVEVGEEELHIRTYERGVEAETYSCGTGVIASALSAVLKGIGPGRSPVDVQTKGGRLQVYFDREGDSFTNIWLQGRAQFVFGGKMEV